jgi:hypothetical protein
MRRTPTEDEIAQRALELYEQAGQPEGRAEEFWREAEAELAAAEAAAETADIPAGIETKR